MSLYDMINAEPDGPRRLAAAEARYDALALLHRAVQRAGLKNSALAKRLGIGKSAVGQVLRGNGNVRITTLSEYLFEAGLRLTLGAEPIDEEPTPVGTERTVTTSTIELTWVNSAGMWTAETPVSHEVGQTLLSARPSDATSVDLNPYEYQQLAFHASLAEMTPGRHDA